MIVLQYLRAAALALLLASASAQAETPAFDRPGISFSTTTLPAGSFAIEQGLPDLVFDNSTDTTVYSANTLVRVGLAANLEVQLATSLYNRLESDAPGSTSASGRGDSGIALKLALPSSRPTLSCALLGGVVFDTGEDPFTAGANVYSLGTTLSWALAQTESLSLFAGVDHADGETVYSVSPSLGFELSEVLGAYVEAGATLTDTVNDYVVGGGIAWMVTDTVQLDVYADGGLGSNSTDLQAGFGVSAFFD